MKNSFEDNLKKLEEIVNELEKGNVPLEDAIKKYTSAMELATSCDTILKDASAKVNKIVNEDGSISDFDENQAE